MVPLCGLAYICFFYQFLGGGLAHALVIPTIISVIGVISSYRLLNFRSKSLFCIVSIPYIFSLYLIPIVIWNLIYIFAVAKPVEDSSSSLPEE